MFIAGKITYEWDIFSCHVWLPEVLYHIGQHFMGIFSVVAFRQTPYMVGASNLGYLAKDIGLVGGFNHLEKYEFVNGKDYPICYGK
jgi:hypothetical protein